MSTLGNAKKPKETLIGPTRSTARNESGTNGKRVVVTFAKEIDALRRHGLGKRAGAARHHADQPLVFRMEIVNEGGEAFVHKCFGRGKYGMSIAGVVGRGST